MQFVAMYINCFSGKFLPYGIFDNQDAAQDWIDDIGSKKPKLSDYSLWEVVEITVVT